MQYLGFVHVSLPEHLHRTLRLSCLYGLGIWGEAERSDSGATSLHLTDIEREYDLLHDGRWFCREGIFRFQCQGVRLQSFRANLWDVHVLLASCKHMCIRIYIELVRTTIPLAVSFLNSL